MYEKRLWPEFLDPVKSWRAAEQSLNCQKHLKQASKEVNIKFPFPTALFGWESWSVQWEGFGANGRREWKSELISSEPGGFQGNGYRDGPTWGIQALVINGV